MIVFRCFILTAKTDGMDYLERYSLNGIDGTAIWNHFYPIFPIFLSRIIFRWAEREILIYGERFFSPCFLP